jgi:cellulose synthase/poly-beta-1,6-N-acetylglucosamine synthase-like glycosyltransferase
MAVFYITGFVLLLYLAYPFCIGLLARKGSFQNEEVENVSGVSLILLSFNGASWLEEKIRFLLDELSGFDKSELIIIDDMSTDKSSAIIKKYSSHPAIRAVLKNQHRGIADSMNCGVALAKYDCVIFSDQRQGLCKGSLQRIVEPLRLKKIGAVSGCISHIDKACCDSLMRRHENFIKNSESAIGNLIGVYGPLYAFKKKYFVPVPEHIILDDLYLSLKILKSGQIVLIKDCAIIDEEFSVLYNYQRTKRYLAGLVQILFSKTIIDGLKNIQFLMLIWHKYLRLLLPVLLSLSYLISAVKMNQGLVFFIVFMVMSFLGVLALLQMVFKFQSRLINIVRINLYYLFAFFDLSVGVIVHQLSALINKKPPAIKTKNRIHQTNNQGNKKSNFVYGQQITSRRN